MLKTSFVGVRRSLVALAATAATAVALLGASPAAQAQPATPDYAQSSSDLSFDDVLNDTRENAWNSRNAFLKQVSESNPEAASQIRPVLDSTMDVVFRVCALRRNAKRRLVWQPLRRHAKLR